MIFIAFYEIATALMLSNFELSCTRIVRSFCQYNVHFQVSFQVVFSRERHYTCKVFRIGHFQAPFPSSNSTCFLQQTVTYLSNARKTIGILHDQNTKEKGSEFRNLATKLEKLATKILEDLMKMQSQSNFECRFGLHAALFH